ncbi:MAG TPA: hypothetical protein VFA18_14890 [Gemmataceae bacterium]|nr:hypothetical protein [Gemmataceae bacterium]
MDFRWAAGIAIWTILSGPIFSGPAFMPKSKHRPARVVYLGSSSEAKTAQPTNSHPTLYSACAEPR